jgi:integrase
MADPAQAVRIMGPLALCKDGLISELRSRGYTPLSIRNLLYLTAHLSHWLIRISLQPGELTSQTLERFLRHRRKIGYTWLPTVRGLEAVLNYLRRQGVVPTEERKNPERTALAELLERYGKFLAQERSLNSGVIRRYQDIARCFLSATQGARSMALDDLRTADVVSFVLAEARRSSVGYVKFKVTALRSFLRYLHIRGEIPGDLSGAVPAIAGWRLASLPQALEGDQTRRLLLAFDRRTRAGRRGYAAVILMLRLGLRACEVASLKLDDCDWSRGELIIRGKQGRQDRLPIPQDVGEVIVSYLRFGRPRSALRGLFLSEHAPHRNMTRSMVTNFVRKAGERSGIPSLGTHRLRHTAATQMLRKGAPLHEIGQVLRHRSVDTTAIYAKVDYRSLRLVSRPWPGAMP